MTITIDTALRLLEQKKELVRELESERQTSASIVYDIGDSEEYIQSLKPARQVDVITEEIEFVQNQIRQIYFHVSKTNLETETGYTYNNTNLKLGEAIMLLKQLRKESKNVSYLANLKNQIRKRKERVYVGGDAAYQLMEEKTELLYNADVYKNRVKELEKTIEEIQTVINQLNASIVIPFENESYSK